jgi:hypothetical protein
MQFSLQAASPETFGHTIVHSFYLFTALISSQDIRQLTASELDAELFIMQSCENISVTEALTNT